MAKSARASSRKANNRALKKNVFGPVEDSRTERLSSKLLELAAQPKPEREAPEASMDADEGATNEDGEGKAKDTAAVATEETSMDVDGAAPPRKISAPRRSSGRIQKKQKASSKIVFPKYKDRKGGKKKA